MTSWVPIFLLMILVNLSAISLSLNLGEYASSFLPFSRYARSGTHLVHMHTLMSTHVLSKNKTQRPVSRLIEVYTSVARKYFPFVPFLLYIRLSEMHEVYKTKFSHNNWLWREQHIKYATYRYEGLGSTTPTRLGCRITCRIPWEGTTHTKVYSPTSEEATHTECTCYSPMLSNVHRGKPGGCRSPTSSLQN